MVRGQLGRLPPLSEAAATVRSRGPTGRASTCRIAMATLMDRDGIPMSEVVANGQWEDEAMARTYIRLHDALASQQRNLCDVHWGPGHVGGAAERAQEGAAEVEISEVAPVESQSVPLIAAGLHTLGSIQQPPWESEAAMPRPAEEIAAAVMEKNPALRTLGVP
mmetsp:Transcript_20825/g.61553  ORF Transcript_20825/g.61553 Transcript_20825/m.61553 type:complete len:164 (-) Transcript_20825:236-727(-)